ncbi:MAG: ribose-phosphate pyrophosphokinase [Bdellovibrionaceae bacterium]|nr:ribose-phosphate pyrophosphokinase [Pseudobdellovibrionaceae bacterium]
MKIFSGSSNPVFSESIAKSLNTKLGDITISRFADGEIFVQINENVRGLHVFIIQSTCPPVNENYMELFLILDALKRASAQEITLVMPYYGYSRQDRKSAPRVPISAKCVADMCSSAGANRLLVVDLHSPQVQGFFNIPVDNLFAEPVLAQAWKDFYSKKENIVVVSPDAGGTERTRAFAKKIEGASVAMIDKRRQEANRVKALNVVGDVKDKTALILDDMIDTAGTLCEASVKLLEAGAEQVYALATHPLFSGSAIENIEQSPIKTVFVTDTIPLKESVRKSNKIQIVSLAPLVATAITSISTKHSVSRLFN